MLTLANGVKENATGAGTGDLTLTGSFQPIYFTFNSQIPNLSKVYYTLKSGVDLEFGEGTFTSPATLSRDIVFQSSNANNKITLTGGAHEVWISVPSRKALVLDENDTLGDPTPFRNTVFLADRATMIGEALVADGEMVFIPFDTVEGDGLGGYFRKATDATAEDTFNTWRNLTNAGWLHKRQRIYVQSPFYYGRFDFSPHAIEGAVDLRFYSAERAGNPNSYFGISTPAASRLAIGARVNQGGVVNFANIHSVGNDTDRIEFVKPISLPDFGGVKANLLANTFFAESSFPRYNKATGLDFGLPIVPAVAGMDCGTFKTLAGIRGFDHAAAWGNTAVYVRLNGVTAAGQTNLVYEWNSGSAAADDGINVLRPTIGAAAAGAGRLLLVAAIDVNAQIGAGDATPSVAMKNIIITNGGTTIIDFDDGYEGQIITVLWDGVTPVSIANSANIVASGGADILMNSGSKATMFHHRNGVWYQIGGGGAFAPRVSTLAALGAIGDPINTTSKAKNSLVDDENGRTYKALGPLAADGWRPLDDQSGAAGSDILPA